MNWNRDRGELTALVQAATLGSVATCVLRTPLDVAKHSAQAAMAPKRALPGVMEAFKAAMQPGVTGLWRGSFPALGLAALTPSLFLLAYEPRRGSVPAVEAGLTARVFYVLALQPLEFMRTCRQGGALLSDSASAHLYRSAFEVAASDWPRSLWRGLIATTLREVGFAAVCWQSYARLRPLLVGPDGEEPADEKRVATGAAVAAAASGALAAALTQPFDVIKTRMQVHRLVSTDYQGFRKVKVPRFWATLRDTYAIAGPRGLWTGGLARVTVSAGAGLLLGPLFEFAQVITDDSSRPLRKPFFLGEDPSRTIVHPRSTRSDHIQIS